MRIKLLAAAVVLAGLVPSVALADGSGPKQGGRTKGGSCTITTSSGTSFTCNPPIPSNVHVGAVGGTTETPPSGWGLGVIFDNTHTITLNLVGSSGPFTDTILLIVVPTNLVSTMTFTPAGSTAVVVNASSFVAEPLNFSIPGGANLHPVNDSLTALSVNTSSGLSLAFVDLNTPLTNGMQITFLGVPAGTVIYAYGANGGALVVGTPNTDAAVFHGSQVPEPASGLLLGSGFAALARWLRKKRASA